MRQRQSEAIIRASDRTIQSSRCIRASAKATEPAAARYSYSASSSRNPVLRAYPGGDQGEVGWLFVRLAALSFGTQEPTTLCASHTPGLEEYTR